MSQPVGHAVLQVPVPALEDWIVARTKHYDAGFVSTDPGFHHAHITVLAPLRSWRVEAFAELAEHTAPFSFRLDRVDVFPDGFIHLRPDPDDRFRKLTRAARASHPQVRPFGGPTPTPHLTLDLVQPDVSPASTRDLLGDTIPVVCRAETLELVWYESGNCHLIDSWPLHGRGLTTREGSWLIAGSSTR